MGSPAGKLREMYEGEKARADAAEANALAVAQERLEERAHRERDWDAQKKALAAANARADASDAALSRAAGEMIRLEGALAAARRDLPVGLEWQAILDALLFTERECGLVSDAHLRVRPKVEALAAPAAGVEGKP